MSSSPSPPFLRPEGHSPPHGRRHRTESWSERVDGGETFKGVIKEFCRNKGHGFVTPADGGEALFCHISDIDGDVLPKAGDEVVFKKMPIPPKMVKFEAVHVRIQHMTPSKHETWEGEPAINPDMPN